MVALFLVPIPSSGQSDQNTEATKMADMAWKLKELDPDSSLWYARQALAISQEVSDRKIQAYSLSDIGNYFKRQESYDSAKHYLRASLCIRRKYLGKPDQISGLNLMALVFRQQEMYDSAGYYYDVGLSQCAEIENQTLRAKLLDGRGIVRMHRGDYSGSLRDINEGLAILSSLGDSLGMANSWQNLGIVNQEIGNRLQAQRAYEQARNLYLASGSRKGLVEILVNEAGLLALDGNLVDAQNKLETALEISITEGFLSNLSAIYNNLATIHASRGDLSKALSYHQLDFERSISQGKNLAAVEAGLNLVRLNLGMGKIRDVARLLPLISSRIDTSAPSWIAVEDSRLRGQYYAAIGDYGKAYQHSMKALDEKTHLGELFNRAQQKEELLSQERHKSILLLESNQRQEAELERKTAENIMSWTIATAAILIAASLLIITVIIQRGQKLKIAKAEAERDASAERNARLEKDEEISRIIKHADEKTYEAILETQESVRIMVAQDLHDQIGSNLSLVQILMNDVEPHLTGLSEKIREQFGRAESLLDSSCEDVRKLSRQMKMGNVGPAGLIPSLEEYFKVINQYVSTKIAFSYKGQIGRLGAKAEHEISAIVKTYIDNVLRHAHASVAKVDIYVSEDQVNLSMEDDGVGFDINEESFRRGSGLGNIQARALILNGQAVINSKRGKGTQISIEAKA